VSVCQGNAGLLQGLLRSIGIDSRQVFVWGGKPNNPPNLEVGGKLHFYNYRVRRGNLFYESPETFRVKRPEKNRGGESVEKDPHFIFHALVELESKYYDPSYGSDLYSQSDYPFSEVKFLETVSFENPTDPKFKKDSDTIPFTVKALHLPNFCYTANCNVNTFVTNRYCKHSVKLPKQTTSIDFDGEIPTHQFSDHQKQIGMSRKVLTNLLLHFIGVQQETKLFPAIMMETV
jgi:hypothetical protein